MKKKNKSNLIIIGAISSAVVLIIVIASMYFKSSNQAKLDNQNQANSQSNNTTQNLSTNTEGASAGAYIDYSDNAIKNTKGTKVLFFHAPWCPQCRALDNSIKSGKIPNGVTIIKVDYDSNQELRKKYGVTLQTTLVRVDDDGNMVKKYTAYNEPSLDALIKNVL